MKNYRVTYHLKSNKQIFIDVMIEDIKDYLNKTNSEKDFTIINNDNKMA